MLRYAVGGAFLIGISRSSVAKVRVARVATPDGATVERSTVATPAFPAVRFVVVSLPARSVVQAVEALDSNGQVLTHFDVNRPSAAVGTPPGP